MEENGNFQSGQILHNAPHVYAAVSNVAVLTSDVINEIQVASHEEVPIGEQSSSGQKEKSATIKIRRSRARNEQLKKERKLAVKGPKGKGQTLKEKKIAVELAREAKKKKSRKVKASKDEPYNAPSHLKDKTFEGEKFPY